MNTLQLGLIQGNLRCFGANCNMSQNTRFLCYFFLLKYSSVPLFSLVSAVPLWSLWQTWITLQCYHHVMPQMLFWRGWETALATFGSGLFSLVSVVIPVFDTLVITVTDGSYELQKKVAHMMSDRFDRAPAVNYRRKLLTYDAVFMIFVTDLKNICL